MARDVDLRRYTAAELRGMRARGESLTDFAAVRAKTEEQLEQDIASDPDWRDVPEDWYKSADLVIPAGKRLLSIRIDTDVLNWFRQQGSGYQTRMNAILRAYMEQKAKARV